MRKQTNPRIAHESCTAACASVGGTELLYHFMSVVSHSVSGTCYTVVGDCIFPAIFHRFTQIYSIIFFLQQYQLLNYFTCMFIPILTCSLYFFCKGMTNASMDKYLSVTMTEDLLVHFLACAI